VTIHEPMRLHIIVESLPEKIITIIQRHRHLREMFNNQWAHLIACDPETGQFLGYHPDGKWETLHPGEGVPSVPVRQG
jgi:uncharacterized protein YbcC (UPF0753/DUF2309 family)